MAAGVRSFRASLVSTSAHLAEAHRCAIVVAMKKAAVILGAGASYDVHNGAVPVKDSNMRPPLARQLFEPRFWQWMSQYRGAEVLGAELARLAQRQEVPFDLEAKLSEYASSKDQRTRDAFKQVPPYLRDIVNAVVGGYIPSPSSYINLVRRLLTDGTHEIMFVVLNYDVFLEDALNRYDTGFSFNDIPEYLQEGRQAKVVKIHGSANWAIPMPDTGGWHKSVRDFDPSLVSDAVVTVIHDRTETVNWRMPNRALAYPHLTAPLREKSFCCPEAHTQALRGFLAGCHKFLIVGTSGLDEDLLGVMAECCSDTGHLVHYVRS